MNPVRRRLLTLSLLIGLIQIPYPLFAAAKPKRAPKFLGEKVTYQGKMFTSVRVKIKGKSSLAWDSGVVIPPQPSPSLTPSPSPSASPTPLASAKSFEKVNIVVGNVTDIPMNSAKRFEGKNRYGYLTGYLVIHNPDGFIALNESCTHQGCAVKIQSEGFHCSCHNALFDGKNGAVLRGPAAHPLVRVDIREEGGQLIISD